MKNNNYYYITSIMRTLKASNIEQGHSYKRSTTENDLL